MVGLQLIVDYYMQWMRHIDFDQPTLIDPIHSFLVPRLIQTGFASSKISASSNIFMTL